MAKKGGGSSSKGPQGTANQAAKKAASDGKITSKEASRITQNAAQSGANAAIAIAKAAASNQAQIAKEVQRSLGLDQTGKGVNYNPMAGSPINSGVTAWNGSSIKPGTAPITGYASYQTSTPSSGSTRYQTPVYTFFNKPKAQPAAPAPASGEAKPASTTEQTPMNGMTDEWGKSVDSGLEEMQAILRQQMEANANQTSLYMGMMQDMMSQMQNANQAPSTPQGAYAATSYQVAPATGAVTTTPIAARKPLANTDLSIPSSYDTAAGVGLNLAI